MRETIEMDEKGRVLVPKRIREQLRLDRGSKMTIEMTEDSIVLKATDASTRNETEHPADEGVGRLRKLLSQQ